jgi:hypothetical protein
MTLRYYDHLQRDDYYSRDGEPQGRKAGRGAERVSLVGTPGFRPGGAALARNWRAKRQTGCLSHPRGSQTYGAVGAKKSAGKISLN